VGTAGQGDGRRALVTGCAGFIGSHLSERLLADGWDVVGLDIFTDFYRRSTKLRNLEALLDEPAFEFHELDLCMGQLDDLVDGVDTVFHLAAQAGVRGSFGATFDDYVRNNVIATQRLLDAMVLHPGASLVYASSSSVYGNAERMPTGEDCDRHPVSPYGMTKVATEELAGVYSRTYGLPTVGLRYFTAYGPRQRPDMAFSRFIDAALRDAELVIHGDGEQARDFTYVDDVVTATIAASALRRPEARVFNVGGGEPVSINKVLELLEDVLERPLEIRYGAPQLGDARRTSANAVAARDELGFTAQRDLEAGVRAQVDWAMSVGAARRPLVVNGPGAV
jgi:nucleoside-diphosphate-sugar epimerase